MTRRTRVHTVICGILSILAGGLLTEGGVQEVISWWSLGSTSNVVLGALGALASIVLLVSGAAFCTRQAFGRKWATAGTLGMIPVHCAGWMLGAVGVPGLILGVIYPALLLVVLRIRPSLGAPAAWTGRGSAGETLPPSSDSSRRRAALDVAG